MICAMDERERRIARNEALFREVNEKVEALNEGFGTLAGQFLLVCECGDEACIEQISLTRGEYERVRSDPALFAVKPGHDVSDEAIVVAKEDGYWVVEKRPGEAAAIATELDSRDRS